MLGIVSDGRVGGSTVCAILIIHRQVWQKAVGPGLTAVGGSRKTNIATAPAYRPRTTGDVESRNNGRARGKHVGLNLGLVHAVGVREGIDADPLQRELPLGLRQEQ